MLLKRPLLIYSLAPPPCPETTLTIAQLGNAKVVILVSAQRLQSTSLEIDAEDAEMRIL